MAKILLNSIFLLVAVFVFTVPLDAVSIEMMDSRLDVYLARQDTDFDSYHSRIQNTSTSEMAQRATLTIYINDNKYMEIDRKDLTDLAGWKKPTLAIIDDEISDDKMEGDGYHFDVYNYRSIDHPMVLSYDNVPFTYLSDDMLTFEVQPVTGDVNYDNAVLSVKAHSLSPSTVWLFGFALIGLLSLRRRFMNM